MSVLILGGSGFIGSKVVEQLSKADLHPITYDIVQSNISGNKVKWVKADILDSLSLERLFYEYNVESAVHLIGLPAIELCEKDPELSFKLNVLSLQNTLEAMRKAEVKKIFFSSSAAVYGYSLERPVKETDNLQPNTIYGYHKFIAEKLIESYDEAYGLKHVILRLFNVYGTDPSVGKDVISIFIQKALNQEPIMVKGGNKFRDFIHVDDIAKIVYNLIPSSFSGILNVGTGKKTTLKEIANLVKTYFRTVETMEEKTNDDGTGIIADTNQLKNLIDFTPIDPIIGIKNHIKLHLK